LSTTLVSMMWTVDADELRWAEQGQRGEKVVAPAETLGARVLGIQATENNNTRE